MILVKNKEIEKPMIEKEAIPIVSKANKLYQSNWVRLVTIAVINLFPKIFGWNISPFIQM